MGGYGSSRWLYHTKKSTVEECRVLDIGSLVRDNLLQHEYSSGSITWRDYTGQVTSTVGYTLSEGLFTLHYHFTSGWNKGKHIDLPIQIQTTEPHYGGLRYWFTCPLVKHGRACNRRVTKLYLPPGGLYYGCRHCYDLSYTSSQEAHKYERMGGELGDLISKLDQLMKEEKKLEKVYSKKRRNRRAV